MVENSRVVFIVGFERCSTSSLASHLVENGYCSLLVNGIKEPKVFSSDPVLAIELVRRGAMHGTKWLLDASVNYVLNPKALAAIAETIEDYRIIVCLRDQLQRTVSAYKLYQALFTRTTESVPWTEWPYCVEFGDEGIRAAAAADPLAPPKLRQPPRGKYVHTAIAAFADGAYDAHMESETLKSHDDATAAFASEAFPTRVVRELQHFRKSGRFPLISVLHNSYFAWPIGNLLKMFDGRRILFITLGDEDARGRLDATLQRFIERPRQQSKALPHLLASEQFGMRVSSHDVALAEHVLRPSLLDDSRNTVAHLRPNGNLDLSLFSPTALYR